MIPKKIHYCWFGHNKKSKLMEDCIASWRKFFPDYEIIEWNEENFDVNQCDYVRKAYEEKKWAFVSDYARMKILSENGGIYFDTDVEVIKAFPEALLEKAFTCIEGESGFVSPGLVFACEPHHEITQQIVDEYENDIFNFGNSEAVLTINKRITRMLLAKGLKQENSLQKLDLIDIYPSEYFCAKDKDTGKMYITDNTYSIHHYAGTWLEGKKKYTNWMMNHHLAWLVKTIVLIKRKVVK